ncbi:MAG: hypothetical protein AAF725_18150 [Acidobacteriota bacterium]
MALEIGGESERDAASTLERRLPVYPWRGREGRLRLVDADRQASVDMGYPEPKTYARQRILEDFEGESFAAMWRQTWSPAPQSSAEIARRFGVQYAQGRGLASSLGRAGELEMRSHPFTVADDHLVMAVYDLGDSRCGVHLWIDGERVRSWTGRRSGEVRMLKWDLRAYGGRSAELQLVDGDPDPGGALAVDSIRAVGGP